jgi:hypothetical protein
MPNRAGWAVSGDLGSLVVLLWLCQGVVVKKVVVCGLLLVGLLLSNQALAEWRNGNWVNPRPYRKFLSDSTYGRPTSPKTSKIKQFYDTKISKLPRNAKGIEFGATQKGDGSWICYRQINIWHCEISDAWRDGGIHSDFIRIFGGGDQGQDVPISVTLEDIYIHDGNALPIVIQDGIFDHITFKDLRVENVFNSPQLATINSGRIDRIDIENCPGLRVTVMGKPGTIKVAYVKNSPGAEVFDATNINGVSGCKIIYDKVSAPAQKKK